MFLTDQQLLELQRMTAVIVHAIDALRLAVEEQTRVLQTMGR